jgi:hypothetical protein
MPLAGSSFTGCAQPTGPLPGKTNLSVGKLISARLFMLPLISITLTAGGVNSVSPRRPALSLCNARRRRAFVSSVNSRATTQPRGQVAAELDSILIVDSPRLAREGTR